MPRPIATDPYQSPTGKVQVVGLVSTGLRAATLKAAEDSGETSLSAMIRRALMAYLKCDADGRPVRARRERAS